MLDFMIHLLGWTLIAAMQAASYYVGFVWGTKAERERPKTTYHITVEADGQRFLEGPVADLYEASQVNATWETIDFDRSNDKPPLRLRIRLFKGLGS